MNNNEGESAPQWVTRFLDALKAGKGVRAACREAGVGSSTPYARRETNDAFRAEWDAVQPIDARKAHRKGPAAPRDAAKVARFLEELAITSNVAAAAAVADLPTSKVYALRRTDPGFAKAWYTALSEGYDNLEMELLAHLRGSESGAPAESTRKFDTATALRCLTAHRESVARERGRRTLAEEAATIASINAKIDAMRERARQGDRAIRAARKALRQRTSADGED